MRLSEIFRALFINIIANRFRVVLTMLGIIVGAATIIMVVGIGKASEKAVEDQFAMLNVGTLYIQSASGTKFILSKDDVDMLNEQSQYLQQSTIVLTSRTEISSNYASSNGSISGVTSAFDEMSNLTMYAGSFIEDSNELRRERVAVIGYDLAEILFPDNVDSALGQDVTISGRRYNIIGIVNRVGDAIQGIAIDESVVLPYSTAESYVLGSSGKPKIIAVANDIDSVELALFEINELFRVEYQNKGGASIMIKDAGSKLVAAQDSAHTMSVLLISVAVIVLIVGGIGIMNVLFVSVKERTKEIGILKALGARRQDILLQFLFESILISFLGGVVGIVFSFAMLPLMDYLKVDVIPTMEGYLLALVFSVVTGTFFGYYPATRAASLKPIDALRYE
ncbi:MAG: ABC transporter permease [Clostridia bacterium]|nr:ABC transporter permease [Clostridia bacterium]